MVRAPAAHQVRLASHTPHRRRPLCVCAANWLNLLATGLPSAVAFFMNYIIIHAFFTNVFRFFW
jgi:hypothetical protein